MRLKIETIGMSGSSMETKKVSGFMEGELEELKRMPHEEAKERLLDILDGRNNGIGRCWYRGNGIYDVWFDNEAAYLNVGLSCD